MNEIILKRPIQTSADITKLNSADLSAQHSNIFDVFKNETSVNYDKYNSLLMNILMQSPTLADIINKLKENKNHFEVVFPEGFLEKIKNGELTLINSRDTDDYLPFIRDIKTNKIIKQVRIKEIPNPDLFKELLPSIQHMVVMSALNKLSNQLEQIEEKLTAIHKEFNNDRFGKINAGYSIYLEALQINNLDSKKATLMNALALLNEGRSQLIESSKQRLDNIKVGFWNSFIEEFKSINYKKKQQENIKEFYREFFYIQRASQLILLVYNELNESDALLQSIAPLKDFMAYVNKDSQCYKLSEWETSNNDWKAITSSSLQAINNIPSYSQIEQAEINLQITNS